MSDGRAIFAKAVAMMTDACRRVLGEAGLAVADVAHFVPHQANARIIDAVAGKLTIRPDRIPSTLAEFGNSSAATIPLTLSRTRAARTYRDGDILLLAAAGAGLTGGAAAYRL